MAELAVADNSLGVITEGGELPLELLRKPAIISVQKGQKRGRCLIDPAIAGDRHALVELPNDPESGILREFRERVGF